MWGSLHAEEPARSDSFEGGNDETRALKFCAVCSYMEDVCVVGGGDEVSYAVPE